jgi:hypothetical protein
VHERHSLISYARYVFPDVLAAALVAGQTFDLGVQVLQAGWELTASLLDILVIRHTATLADPGVLLTLSMPSSGRKVDRGHSGRLER